MVREVGGMTDELELELRENRNPKQIRDVNDSIPKGDYLGTTDISSIGINMDPVDSQIGMIADTASTCEAPR